MDSASTQYIRQVRKHLVCPVSLKTPFIRQLKTDVQDYCDDNPSADLSVISAHFGSPTDIAEEFLSTLSAQAVARCTSRQKRVLRLTVVVVFSALLLMAVLVIRDYQLQQKLYGDDFLATITYAKDSGTGQDSIIKNPESTR